MGSINLTRNWLFQPSIRRLEAKRVLGVRMDRLGFLLLRQKIASGTLENRAWFLFITLHYHILSVVPQHKMTGLSAFLLQAIAQYPQTRWLQIQVVTWTLCPAMAGAETQPCGVYFMQRNTCAYENDRFVHRVCDSNVCLWGQGPSQALGR